MATQRLIGRLTAGAGAFEEIPLSTYMASLLNAADYAALAGLMGLFEAGDLKFTYRTTASVGWLLMLGGAAANTSTIGNAGSAANLRANADTLALYTVIWNGCDNTIAPVYTAGSIASTTTRGANAAADFAANKAILIPSPVGNAIVGAGIASSNGTVSRSARTLGSIFGAETMTLGTTHLPPYTPTGSVATTGNQTSYAVTSNTTGNLQFGGTGSGAQLGTPLIFTSTFTGNPQGGVSTPFILVQPSIGLNCMVKL
jgi:hypothetical protein